MWRSHLWNPGSRRLNERVFKLIPWWLWSEGTWANASCRSPLHAAVTADVILPTHRVDLPVQCAHSHAATAVDHARRCPPLVVLRTELLDQTGRVLPGPSANYQNKTGHAQNCIIFLIQTCHLRLLVMPPVHLPWKGKYIFSTQTKWLDGKVENNQCRWKCLILCSIIEITLTFCLSVHAERKKKTMDLMLVGCFDWFPWCSLAEEGAIQESEKRSDLKMSLLYKAGNAPMGDILEEKMSIRCVGKVLTCCKTPQRRPLRFWQDEPSHFICVSLIRVLLVQILSDELWFAY